MKYLRKECEKISVYKKIKGKKNNSWYFESQLSKFLRELFERKYIWRYCLRYSGLKEGFLFCALERTWGGLRF